MISDEKLDLLFEQWAQEEIPLPDDFHQVTMQKINEAAHKQRKHKQRRLRTATVAAAILLCCIPITKYSLDQLHMSGNGDAQPMVAQLTVDEMAVPETPAGEGSATNGSDPATNATDDSQLSVNHFASNGAEQTTVIHTNGADQVALKSSSEDKAPENKTTTTPETIQSSVVPGSAEDIGQVPSLAMARNAALPDHEASTTAADIERYQQQLSAANDSLQQLNEQLADYEKQLQVAPDQELQAKKETINQKISDLEQQIKTLQDSLKELETKLEAEKNKTKETP